ncbi:ATP-binding protein [Rhodopirellula sp. SWK7]|uniref:sensor histidine kinase n=1 Tax=Rhodopirellula sp. SWK7 TaxID=595460 RepID=UPI001F2CDA99|nr:ATP-binding protein [Rhodopirellula sp. SWK7]
MFEFRMQGGSRVCAALFTVVLAFGGCQATTAVAEIPDEQTIQNVVVVYSYGHVLPANEIVDRVLRENLQSSGDSNIEIYSEYLDIARFPDAEHLIRTRTSLQEKYSDRRVDLVIAGGSVALEFLLESRDSLFSESSLIYTCVDREKVLADDQFKKLNGIQMRLDLVATLNLAFALQPEAKELVVVTGASQLDREWKRTTDEQLSQSRLDAKLKVTHLNGLSMDRLVERVQLLPEEAIVLFLLCMQDGNGEHFFSPNVVERLANVSPAPLYGVYNTYHGKGIVGGHFATFEDLAKATAELALQILNGSDPQGGLKVSQAPIQNHLDWRQLQHWGLDQSHAPAESVIAFRELSAWELYPGRIIAAATLIVIQAGLIAVLLVQIQRRRKAEQSQLASQEIARQQRDELARVNRVTTVGELSTSIAHEVNQPLSAIVSNAQAAIRLLQQSPPDTDEVAAALRDIAGDGNRAAGILNHVRSLSKKEQPIRAVLDLNAVVRDVLRLVAPDAVSRGIVIREELDRNLPHVEADKIGIQQVVLNLLINAAQAMQDVERTVRQIVVRTTHEDEMVLLSVEDCGVGLDNDQLDQVFHPFFTTRAGGIGMGLSISQSIVESHEGQIGVTRNATYGVTFHVRLAAVCAAVNR